MNPGASGHTQPKGDPMENRRHPQQPRVRIMTLPSAWSKPWLFHASALMVLTLMILSLIVKTII